MFDRLRVVARDLKREIRVCNRVASRNMGYDEMLEELKSLSDPQAVAGMARFGIKGRNPLGVPVPVLRKIARTAGRNHLLAQQLWSSGYHEARILASMVAVPEMVSEDEMESWVEDFDSWDVCDQCCSNLLVYADRAFEKAIEWSGRTEEYVKRAGFALMAELAAHDKKASDEEFAQFFPHIVQGATDDRNFVKKAVNWALRQIGKRNLRLNKMAIEVGLEIKSIDSRTARWVASDALRELTGETVQKRLSGQQRRIVTDY